MTGRNLNKNFWSEIHAYVHGSDVYPILADKSPVRLSIVLPNADYYQCIEAKVGEHGEIVSVEYFLTDAPPQAKRRLVASVLRDYESENLTIDTTLIGQFSLQLIGRYKLTGGVSLLIPII